MRNIPLKQILYWLWNLVWSLEGISIETFEHRRSPAPCPADRTLSPLKHFGHRLIDSRKSFGCLTVSSSDHRLALVTSNCWSSRTTRHTLGQFERLAISYHRTARTAGHLLPMVISPIIGNIITPTISYHRPARTTSVPLTDRFELWILI